MRELQVSLDNAQKVRLQRASEQLEKLSSRVGSSANASVTVVDTIPVNHEDGVLKGHGTSEVDGGIVATLCGVVEKVNKLVYVRTLRARMGGFYYQFEKGEEVEVMMDGKGFRGALFEAKVVTARRQGKTKISIQYHHLVEDEESMKPLREYVDIINVRPTPPRDLVKEFKFDDLVDCFHDDAWWEGVFTRVRENGSRFLVYFRTSQEEIEFTKEAMRLHREWSDRDGSWNPPGAVEVVEQEQLQPPHEFKQQQQSYSCNKVGDGVEVAGKDDEHSGSWFTATIVERGGKRGRFLVEYQSLNEDGDDRYPLREEADLG